MNPTPITYHCGNCGTVTGTPLPLVQMDLNRDVALERFSPGDYLPTGECEHCGALAYDDSLWKEITRKEAAQDLLEAVEGLLSCPALNMDDMEPEDLPDIDKAEKAVAKAYHGEPILGMPRPAPNQITAFQLDNRQAETEGWALFNDGEIQRLDHGPIVADEQSGHPAFQSDAEAVDFVKAKAKDGSDYHALALKHHNERLHKLAAPDLLKALESMLTTYAPRHQETVELAGEQALHSSVRAARAAIAKAK